MDELRLKIKIYKDLLYYIPYKAKFKFEYSRAKKGYLIKLSNNEVYFISSDSWLNGKEIGDYRALQIMSKLKCTYSWIVYQPDREDTAAEYYKNIEILNILQFKKIKIL